MEMLEMLLLTIESRVASVNVNFPHLTRSIVRTTFKVYSRWCSSLTCGVYSLFHRTLFGQGWRNAYSCSSYLETSDVPEKIDIMLLMSLPFINDLGRVRRYKISNTNGESEVLVKPRPGLLNVIYVKVSTKCCHFLVGGCWASLNIFSTFVLDHGEVESLLCSEGN